MKPRAPLIWGQESFGFRCWHGSGSQMSGAHTHLEIEANWLRRGSLTYLFGGNRVEVRSGEMALFWGSVPHQLIFLEECSEICWFTLPLSRFLGWDLPRALTGAVLNGQVIRQLSDANYDASCDALNFAHWERDLGSGDAARLQIVELEVQARLRRLALHLSQVGSHSRVTKCEASKGELGHVEKMAAFMAQNYEQPIQTQDIARAAGIHPNYAMNLFKREFGLSLGQFLTRTRLSHVQRLLVTTDKKVLEIALACGFGSASRFYAAFKAECDQSPADYRGCFRR